MSAKQCPILQKSREYRDANAEYPGEAYFEVDHVKYLVDANRVPFKFGMHQSLFNLANQPALASLALAYIEEGIHQYRIVNACQQLKGAFEIACDIADGGERSIIRTVAKAPDGIMWTVCPADHGSGEMLIVNAAATVVGHVTVAIPELIQNAPDGLTALEEARREIPCVRNAALAISDLRWKGPLTVANGKGIRTAGIQRCLAVTNADFAQCANLSEVSNGCAMNCPALQAVSLPSGITRIGDDFLQFLTGVAAVDLSHYERLVELGEGFFCNSALEAIAFPRSLTQLGSYFLFGAVRISTVDLGRSMGLEVVPDWFCCECPNLHSVFLPRTITKLDVRFLSGPNKITTIDLTHCERLEEVCDFFANECAALQTVVLPQSVLKLGDFFLDSSPAVTVVDLSRCERLTTVGEEFCNFDRPPRVVLPKNTSNLPPDFLAKWATN